MPIALRDIESFLPSAFRSKRLAFLQQLMRSAAARPISAPECDWLVVYADREHLANIAFLSGYDPRFEEALLLLGPRQRRVLVVGNEGEVLRADGRASRPRHCARAEHEPHGPGSCAQARSRGRVEGIGPEPRPDDRARGLEIFRAG